MGIAFEDVPLTTPNPSVVLQMYLASRHDVNLQRQLVSRSDAHLPYYATSTTYVPSASYASTTHPPQSWPLPAFQQTLALDPYQSTFHTAPVQYESWQAPTPGVLEPRQQSLASPQTVTSDSDTSTFTASDQSATRERKSSSQPVEPSRRSIPAPGDSKIAFDTDVDTLMKTIQFPSKDDQSSVERATADAHFGKLPDGDPVHPSNRKSLKKHRCSHCGMSFVQRTHLEIHLRKHSGEKPFVWSVLTL